MSEAIDPTITVLIGGAELRRGPWGKKIPGPVVALYLALYLDGKLGEDVQIEIEDLQRLPFRFQGEHPERLTEVAAATWTSYRTFLEGGWRDYPELLEGSGEVPS